MRRPPRLRAALFAAGLAIAVIAPCAGHAQSPPAVQDLLSRIGERVAEFYKLASSIICIETSAVQFINFNTTPEGFVRTVESELRVEMDGGQTPGEAAVLRKIRKVNGRAPRERDKKDRSGCTDPNPLSSEPLTFLLPARRPEYQFKAAGMGKDRDRPALMIDFASVNRSSRPALIEDPGGHDDCFDWTGHVASRGRIWVDPETFDVLRVERGQLGPVDVEVPLLIQRRHRLDSWVVVARDDVTIRYRTVAFSNPDQRLLLPESIESLTLVRGGLASMRRHQTFSDYQRFVTEGRIIP